MYCSACGTLNDENNYRCIQCGQILQTPQAAPSPPRQPQPQPHQGGPAPGGFPMAPTPQAGGHYPMVHKSRALAGLLQIFLPFGVGRFYLGYAGTGVAQFLLIFVCGIGAIWSFIDGIMILTGSVNHDANGLPLSG